MATDTTSSETKAKYEGTNLWKPWMDQIRLYQATSLEDVEEFLEQGQDSPRISWDVETMSLDPSPDKVCGHCLAFSPREAIYIPTQHQKFPDANLDHEVVWDMILKAIEAPRILVVYNWKFEGRILRSKGVFRSSGLDKLNDAMIYRWLYDSNKKQVNLKDSVKDLLEQEMIEIWEVPGSKVGKKKKDINFSLTDPEDATLYAAADPVFTLCILDKCKPIVDAEQPMIAQEEHMLLDVIFEMESNPTTIDRAFLLEAKSELTHWIDVTALKIYSKAGKEFNIDSTHKTAAVLSEMGLPLKETAKGNLKTGRDAIESLQYDFPIVVDILLYRSLVKERGTYVEALLRNTTEQLPSAVFKFLSVGAPTGRFSSGGVDEGDPLYTPMNVQAIPSSSKYKKATCRLVENPPSELRMAEVI